MAPMVYPNATRFNLTRNGTRVGGIPLISAAYQTFAEQNFLLGNFSQTNATTGNPLAKFLPVHCTKRRADIVAYPYIGVSGPEKYIGNITRDLNELSKLLSPKTFSILAKRSRETSSPNDYTATKVIA